MQGCEHSEAQRIFNKAFLVPRTPRSKEYKGGAMDALKFKLKETTRLSCPYRSGTVQADAWFAGAEEGRELADEANMPSQV